MLNIRNKRQSENGKWKVENGNLGGLPNFNCQISSSKLLEKWKLEIRKVKMGIVHPNFPLSNFKFQISLLLLLSSSTLHAQEVWTLDSILSRIRTGNPMLQAYEYKIDALNAYAEGAKSWMPPMVGAGTFMTPYPGQEVANGMNQGMFMIAVEQAIPNPAKLEAKENYMESKAAIVATGQGYTYNQLRAQAKNAYYQWAVLEKKKAVLEENLQIMQTMLKLAEIRYPYNQGSLGSIYKAEGRLHQVENKILMIDHDIIEKNIMLNTLMDIPSDIRYQIDTSLQDVDHVLMGIDSAYLLQSRSDLQRIARNIESKQLGIALEKTERKPEFSIRYEHMLPYSDIMTAQYTLMGMVTIPIAPWASKGYKANIKGKRLEIKAMKEEQEAILNEVQGMIAKLMHHFHIKRQQLENYKEKIIPALRRNYETTMLAYEQNQEQLPLVIDAWEALNTAQMQYLDQLGMYYEMIVEYEEEIEIAD